MTRSSDILKTPASAEAHVTVRKVGRTAQQAQHGEAGKLRATHRSAQECITVAFLQWQRSYALQRVGGGEKREGKQPTRWPAPHISAAQPAPQVSPLRSWCLIAPHHHAWNIHRPGSLVLNQLSIPLPILVQPVPQVQMVARHLKVGCSSGMCRTACKTIGCVPKTFRFASRRVQGRSWATVIQAAIPIANTVIHLGLGTAPPRPANLFLKPLCEYLLRHGAEWKRGSGCMPAAQRVVLQCNA